MKNAKFAGVQRLLSAVFAATVALTSVQIPVYATPQTQAAEQTSQLVNIAGDAKLLSQFPEWLWCGTYD